MHELLGDGLARKWWQNPTIWIGAVAVAGAIGGYFLWQNHQACECQARYVSSRGKARQSVNHGSVANGTCSLRRTVNVGFELYGTVRNVLVDVNDTVKKGQVLVELDTDKLNAQLNRSKASVASAQARLQQSQATLKERVPIWPGWKKCTAFRVGKYLLQRKWIRGVPWWTEQLRMRPHLVLR